jgi:16S rRNA (guanine966-N2)-methyltransferase
MEIIAGKAGGVRLEAPRGLEVRPTAVRARKSLFDSLGPLDGKVIADLFAGSGALGLEAASRGASEVVFFDDSPNSLSCIGENSAKVVKAGVVTLFHVVKGRLPGAIERAAALPRPDIVLADPPYAESAALLSGLLAEEAFKTWAAKATVIWEMPDFGLAIDSIPAPWRIKGMRPFGPARFLMLGVS